MLGSAARARNLQRNCMETSMHNQAPSTVDVDHEAIGRYYDGQLRVIARQSVTVWFNRDRLDRLLTSYVNALENCELLYAIDTDGRQVSSNILPDSIDAGAYGQDLSSRPYAISLRVLQDPLASGAFACRSYTSQISQRPCITVMYGVSRGSSMLGYIAADFTQSDN
jgi:hypothetical protein